jgi:hypothetical protein
MTPLFFTLAMMLLTIWQQRRADRVSAVRLDPQEAYGWRVDR